MKLSTLELRPAIRYGNNSQIERHFLDFVVDGVSLYETQAGDFITPFGWCPPQYEQETVARLLLKAEADLPDNRRSLYICSECADLGCGSLTTVIEKTDVFTWRDFGWQRDYDEASLELIPHLGPFHFDKSVYFQAITSATGIIPR